MKYEKIPFNGLTIYYQASDNAAAELVLRACTKSLQLNQHLWGLAPPQDCRIYVLNANWVGCIFHAAPWLWRIQLALALPLWYFRTKSTWQIAAGWALPFGKRRFIGIKPPALIQLSDRSMGSRIFVHVGDLDLKVQHTTCHELTHACAAHLRLPAWLNEGLAMFTVDHFAGETTVRQDTLAVLRQSSGMPSTASYQRMNYKDQNAVIYTVVRGYWITRYYEDTRPGFLKNLLSNRISHPRLENQLASAVGMSQEEFWKSIDPTLISYFSIRFAATAAKSMNAIRETKLKK
jgi:hypothetical protein